MKQLSGNNDDQLFLTPESYSILVEFYKIIIELHIFENQSFKMILTMIIG
jgi:hypothetical protein